MSEAQAKWAAAFVAAQADMPTIPKTQTANMGTYSYKYADLSDIADAVRPVLAKHGLAAAQSPESVPSGIGVVTRIIHEAGHIESFGPLILSANGNAQAVGSAITYARRYALCAALGLVPDEDDDGAKAEVSAPVNSWAEEETGGSPASGSGPSTSSRWKDLRQRFGKAVVLKAAREAAADLGEGYTPSRDSDLENLSDKVYEATASLLAEKQGQPAA